MLNAVDILLSSASPPTQEIGNKLLEELEKKYTVKTVKPPNCWRNETEPGVVRKGEITYDQKRICVDIVICHQEMFEDIKWRLTQKKKEWQDRRLKMRQQNPKYVLGLTGIFKKDANGRLVKVHKSLQEMKDYLVIIIFSFFLTNN